MRDIRERLLDSATAMIQQRGYHDFSFRDLGAAVGITSASIHYHFPTKAILVAQVVERYSAAFYEKIGDPGEGDPAARIRQYAALFRATLASDRNCLCGMIGAEIGGVPAEIGHAVKTFFDGNAEWLAQVLRRRGFGEAAALQGAELILSALEGALLVARASQSDAIFDSVTAALLAFVDPVNVPPRP